MMQPASTPPEMSSSTEPAAAPTVENTLNETPSTEISFNEAPSNETSSNETSSNEAPSNEAASTEISTAATPSTVPPWTFAPSTFAPSTLTPTAPASPLPPPTAPLAPSAMITHTIGERVDASADANSADATSDATAEATSDANEAAGQELRQEVRQEVREEAVDAAAPAEAKPKPVEAKAVEAEPVKAKSREPKKADAKAVDAKTVEVDIEKATAAPPPAVEPQRWRTEIEQLALSLLRVNHRITGVASPDHGTGVSLVAELLALAAATTGRRALLVELSQPFDDDGVEEGGWLPGETDPRRAILTDARGFDRLKAPRFAALRTVFADIAAIRSDFERVVREYDAVIVDLPSVLDADDRYVNTIAMATACDQVCLVAATDQTARARLEESVDHLTAAGASIAGVALNDAHRASIGDDLARYARFLKRFTPQWGRRLERFARRSTLLN